MNFLPDLLSSIKNGAVNRSKYITHYISATNIPERTFAVLNILRKAGVIRGFSYSKTKVNKKVQGKLIIYLKYDAFGISVVDAAFYISKPSRRVYISASSLWQTQSTTGFVALSTVYGIITDIEARRYNVGGEVLFGIN
jgi:small subunit ribosomal protein S8